MKRGGGEGVDLRGAADRQSTSLGMLLCPYAIDGRVFYYPTIYAMPIEPGPAKVRRHLALNESCTRSLLKPGTERWWNVPSRSAY